MPEPRSSLTEQSRVGQTFKRVARHYGEGDMEAFDAITGLLDISAKIRDEFAALYAKHDLARGRFRILLTLCDQAHAEGIAPTELAEFCGISRATVTGIVDMLEKQNLVVRATSEDDRRSIKVHLTDSGRQKVDAILPAMIAVSERAWTELAQGERLSALWTGASVAP